MVSIFPAGWDISFCQESSFVNRTVERGVPISINIPRNKDGGIGPPLRGLAEPDCPTSCVMSVSCAPRSTTA